MLSEVEENENQLKPSSSGVPGAHMNSADENKEHIKQMKQGKNPIKKFLMQIPPDFSKAEKHAVRFHMLLAINFSKLIK